MLIKALCDYYDVLAKSGKVLAEGYSNVKIKYIVCLTEAGEIDEIVNCQRVELIPATKGKVKEKLVPRDMIMPQRTEKPGIDANIVEHRPLYIFGLNYEEGRFTPEDRTGKARKSHTAFVNKNLEYLEDMDKPLINAYRLFIQNWIPENETENRFLLELAKNYSSAGFAFCLSGHIEFLIHEDASIKDKWEKQLEHVLEEERDSQFAFCGVSGEYAPIARIHRKIKGVYGGLATGSVLIGYNNSSENSYGKEQSYNSNISEPVMKKYTETLNYLLDGKAHKNLFDDITVIYWASSGDEECDSLFTALCFGDSDELEAEQVEDMLKALMEDARNGNIVSERITSTQHINPNADFYILGLKPNSSRLSVKFLYQRKYGDILINIAKHQNDMQITDKTTTVPLWRIKKELISPKSSNEKIDPALFSRILESIIYGRNYPSFLFETMVKRVKTDRDMEISSVRAGVIKACINRKSRLLHQKEELKMALDLENSNTAYLCGRLFAVLEKLQQDASNNSLNRTIKDSYFASAVSKPVIVFPKLIKLAQNHLNKSKRPVYFNKLIGEIVDKLQGEFPETLLLAEQGKFIIGYYQQYQSFFVKNEEKINNQVEEDM